ncbi:MAG TPA: DNA polymerase III subunit gamma/tau [Opitutaceae bacterium]|jgi:DNA polymerase-3 subunit delta'
MAPAGVPWPAALEGTPAVAVIERAVGRGRLSHGLLLAGDDTESLAGAGTALADRILNGPGQKHRIHPDKHPDCFQVRPSGRSRQIKVEQIRELIDKVNLTPSVTDRKVAILHEADRMNPQSANILLKTLEEPPADTTIVLLTPRPHSLLPTIRSRVLHFRFPGLSAGTPIEGWDEWSADYGAWLGRLGEGVSGARGAADGIFGAYALAARFGLILDRSAAAEFGRRKATLPEDIDEEEMKAVEAEAAVGIRHRMFASVEAATCAHANSLMARGDAAAPRPLAAAVGALERSAGLLRVNLNESAALEDFLLASLRIWAKR